MKLKSKIKSKSPLNEHVVLANNLVFFSNRKCKKEKCLKIETQTKGFCTHEILGIYELALQIWET